MAMNPMQRKIRNSFLLGILVAIIVAAIIIGLLFMKIKGLNEKIITMQEEQNIAMTYVYVASENLKKDQRVTANSDLMEANDTNKELMKIISMPTQLVPENAITGANIEELYGLTNNKGEITGYSIKAKCDIGKGTVLTTDNLEKDDNYSTYRLVEYTMISLPSRLQTGDFVDIRFAMGSEGMDFIVLSKIKVEDSTTNSIWLKLSESQLQLLNSAVIESYIIEGSKLYATQYTNAAQAALNATYVPDSNIISLIERNKLTDDDQEIVDKANEDLSQNNNEGDIRNYIRGILNQYSGDEKTSKIQEGFTVEKTTIQAAREALLGDMGY